MLYTLTLNPAIDYFLNFKNKLSPLQKTNSFAFLPSGKGINASLFLNRIKIGKHSCFVSRWF